MRYGYFDSPNKECSLFLTRSSFHGNLIHLMHNLEPWNPPAERFFGLADAEISAYCGDRDVFLGTYRGYANPKGIEEGLIGQLNYRGNAVCASI